MDNKRENNSLPTYLKMYIDEENSKYLNKQNITSNNIYKNITDNLNLHELHQYKESMKEGQSYWYSHLKKF